jgi:hypothetical protein
MSETKALSTRTEFVAVKVDRRTVNREPVADLVEVIWETMADKDETRELDTMTEASFDTWYADNVYQNKKSSRQKRHSKWIAAMWSKFTTPPPPRPLERNTDSSY